MLENVDFLSGCDVLENADSEAAATLQPLSLQPLDKRGLVVAVIAGAGVEVESLRALGAREEHHLVAVVIDSDLLSVGKALAGVTFLAVVGVGDDVFDKGVRSDATCKVRNYYAHAGGDDLAVDLVYDDVVVGVFADLFPGGSEVVVLFGKAVFVQIKIKFKQCIQFVFSDLAYHCQVPLFPK